MFLRVLLTLISFAFTTSALACDAPTSAELKDYFGHSSWIEVDENNEIETYKTIKVEMNFESPFKSKVFVGSRRHKAKSICRVGKGIKLSSFLGSATITKNKGRLSVYIPILGKTYDLLPTNSKLIVKAGLAEPNLRKLQDKDDLIRALFGEDALIKNPFEFNRFHIKDNLDGVEI